MRTPTFKWLAIGLSICLLVSAILFIPPRSQASADAPKSLKVLAIGNSFSADGMNYLYQIAENLGYDDIVLGNLMIPGGTLEMHVDYLANNKVYIYEKNTTGEWELLWYTMKQALAEEDWDIITLQQSSDQSGVASSYNEDIETIVNYVRDHAKNPDAKLYWHMTWAYDETSNHTGFANYDRDQMKMYNAIVNAVQTKILPNEQFVDVIPAGTAIQNVRTSHLINRLTRDGYHLSMEIGRFIAGLTWFAKLTGEPIDHLTFVPNQNLQIFADLPLIIEAVKAAVAEPFKVTATRFPDLSPVEKLVNAGIIKGNSSGEVMENQQWRREDITVVLTRMLSVEDIARQTAKNHNFADVDNPYYDGYITWAKENGYFQGHSDVRFGMNEAITVQQFVAVMLRVLGYKDIAWDEVPAEAVKKGLVPAGTDFSKTAKRGDYFIILDRTLQTKTADGEALGQKLGLPSYS